MGKRSRTYSERGFAGASMHATGGNHRGRSYANTPCRKPKAPSSFGEPKRKFEFGSWQDEHGSQ